MPMEKKPDYKGWTVYVSWYKSKRGGATYYAMYGRKGRKLRSGEVRETEQAALEYAHQKIDEEVT